MLNFGRTNLNVANPRLNHRTFSLLQRHIAEPEIGYREGGENFLRHTHVAYEIFASLVKFAIEKNFKNEIANFRSY